MKNSNQVTIRVEQSETKIESVTTEPIAPGSFLGFWFLCSAVAQYILHELVLKSVHTAGSSPCPIPKYDTFIFMSNSCSLSGEDDRNLKTGLEMEHHVPLTHNVVPWIIFFQL